MISSVNPLRVCIPTLLSLVCFSGVRAQTDNFSGTGGNVNLFSPGPYGLDEIALDPLAEEANNLTLGNVRFLPRVEAMLIRESNLFLTGKKQEDTYGVVSPGLMAKMGTAAGNYAYIDYSADIPFLDDEDTESVTSQQAKAMVHYEESKSMVNAWYRFRDVRGADVTLGERLTKQEQAAFGGYDHKTSEKTALGINATYSLNDFESDQYIDYTDLRLAARAYWKATGKTRTYLEGAYGHVDIEGKSDSYGDADYTEARVGAASKLGSRWDLNGHVGHQWRSVDGEGFPEINGWVSGARLHGLLVEHVNAGVSFWTQLQPSVDEAGGTRKETRIQPEISRRLFTDDFVLSGTLVFGMADYETPDTQAADGEIGTDAVFDGRSDEYFGYTLSADWSATRTIKLGAGYSYLDHDAEEVAGSESRDYTAERYMLRGRYNF